MIAVLALLFVVAGSAYSRSIQQQPEISAINSDAINVYPVVVLNRQARQIGEFENIVFVTLDITNL